MRIPAIARFVLMLALLALFPASGGGEPAPPVVRPVFLEGHLLVARPGMGDSRFRESVVYMIKHDETGAVGLIVNKKIGSGPLSHLLRSYGLDVGETTTEVDLHFGGPVDGRQAFALHSGDFRTKDSLTVDEEVFFTAGTEILAAIAAGKGPKKLMLALGKAQWWGGQLERELDFGVWQTVKASKELVFNDGPVNAWDQITGAGGLPL